MAHFMLIACFAFKIVSWFNGSQQPSTATAARSLSPQPVRWGRELEKKGKTLGLR